MIAMFPFLITLSILGALVAITFAVREPSHNRNWADDQKVLPSVSIYGEYVTVHDIRTARYSTVTDYDVSYTDKTFKRDDVVRTWMLIEPFGKRYPFSLRASHVLLSFELANGEFISVSPEIRKKGGERFVPLKTFLPFYEFMYVIADERDVVQLRSNYRQDDVYLYPLRLSKEQTQKMFFEIVERVNKLHAHPIFFNTLFNSCATTTTKLLREAGAVLPTWNHLYLFPGNLDSLLYAKNLIDTDLSLKEARKKFYVTDIANKVGDTENFSHLIRNKKSV